MTETEGEVRMKEKGHGELHRQIKSERGALKQFSLEFTFPLRLDFHQQESVKRRTPITVDIW